MQKRSSFLSIVNKRWLPSTIVFALTFFSVGYLRAIMNKPLYQAKGQITFASTSTNNTTNLQNQEQTTLSNDLVLIQSESLAEKVLQDLGDSISKIDLQKNFDVNQLDGSNLLELSFISENPQQAALVVNTWLENYQELAEENHQGENQSVAEFLGQELPKRQESLNLATKKLRDFQEKNQVMDATAEARGTFKAISEFDAKIASFQAQLEAFNLKKESLQNIIKIDPQKAITANIINNSPLGSSLLKQLQEVRDKIQQEQLRLGNQHPHMINLREEEKILSQQLQSFLATFTEGESYLSQSDLERIYEVVKTQPQLLNEYAITEREIETVKGQIKSLKELIANYQQRLDKLRVLEFEQQQLKKEVATQEEVVQKLMNNYQNIELKMNSSEDKIKSVEWATVPLTPINSSFRDYLIQGAIAGLILSLLTAVMTERFGESNSDRAK